jgi:hypothetical protein
MLGKEATLFNSGKGTNFIFKFTDILLTEKEIRSINSTTSQNKE